MQPVDMFVMTPDGKETAEPPAEKKLTRSQCTPLFFNAYTMRDAGACIHTHSPAAVMVTLLCDKEFRITHQVWCFPSLVCLLAADPYMLRAEQEMIKGIRIGSTRENLRYFDELVVPIIENTVTLLSRRVLGALSVMVDARRLRSAI